MRSNTTWKGVLHCVYVIIETQGGCLMSHVSPENSNSESSGPILAVAQQEEKVACI